SELGDTWGTALAFMALGAASRCRGQFAVARTYYEKSLAARREFGRDPIGVAQCMWHIATTATVEGRHEEAMGQFREAGCAAKQAGDLGLAVRSLTGLARAARAEGCLADAGGALEESLALCQAAGFREQHAEILAEQADIALGHNDAAAARQAAECALALDEANPHAGLVAARLELLRGKRSQALRDLREALRHALRRRDCEVIAEVALTLAELCMQDRDPVDAATMAWAVLDSPATRLDQRARAEAILGALGPRDSLFAPRQGSNPESSLGAVAALVLSRVLRSSSCGAAAGVVPLSRRSPRRVMPAPSNPSGSRRTAAMC
ncbi:tetratricopeptide repeat protein, partial [Candidatus Fermentibacteria bacterium]|nr:tetratricopeptide repeat protein [Candidatus Fermentibacteria bacterium]